MAGDFQNIDPPLTARGGGGGGHTRRAVRGVNILEDARHSSVLYACKYFVAESF